ncbi:FK506-binding protein 5-like, partial [Bombus impatiens]|uniref:FK506-binding protein 5-like n=1 Tax=Bombus impatiens TaxID=132113 RepID=A0A6P8LPE6_BOMIM
TTITVIYPVTTEVPTLVELTEALSSITGHWEVNITSPYVNETIEILTTELTVETAKTTEFTITSIVSPVVTTTEAEVYEIYEETVPKEEYEEKDEEAEEEEEEETFSPPWYDYEELNITTPFVTIPEIVSTTLTLLFTEETTLKSPAIETTTKESIGIEITKKSNITTLKYTLPPTSKFTTEYLPIDYLEENITRPAKVTTLIPITSTKVSNITKEKVSKLPISPASTTPMVTRTTNQEQKKQRQEEKKEELIEELKQLEQTAEIIIDREKKLDTEEKEWEMNKARRMHEIFQKQKEMKTAYETKSSSTTGTERVNGEPSVLPEVTPPVNATAPKTDVVPMKPEMTIHPAMTTEDELEAEVEDLKKKYSEKEKWLEVPPTEKTTIEIRETTVAEPTKETSVRKIITQSQEEEEEEEEHEERVKVKDTTKMCLNVLKSKPLEEQAEGLVTGKLCLPFSPDKEQRTKISGLHLKEHEWTESAFTKGHEKSQTELEKQENRFKRNIPQRENVCPEFLINQFTNENEDIKTQIEQPFSKYGNRSFRLTNIFMITEASKTTEKSYWKISSNRYKVRSMLQVIEVEDKENEEDDEIIVKRDETGVESCYYEDQVERNPRQDESTSPGTTESTDDEIEEETVKSEIESSEDNSFKNDADRKTESVPEKETYSKEDEVEEVTESQRIKEKPSERKYKDKDKEKDGKGKEKSRQTPGPEWPTEALTAYHVGGTKIWMLEYPEREFSELKEGEQDVENVGERPLEATTCYYVILENEEGSIENPEKDYDKENSFESSLKEYIPNANDQYPRYR